MVTFVFDFDSTLISCESLEVILQQQLSQDVHAREEIKQITENGIRGKISFASSLKKRLEIAVPKKQDVINFGQEAYRFLTPGMEEFFEDLRRKEAQVWIISGGILESLIPLGERLHVPRSRIHGVQLLWNPEGQFIGIDESVPFCRSKVEGCGELVKNWDYPVVAIGDSMSDYRLFEAGLVDRFVVFTQHYQCEEVINKGVNRAGNVAELKMILREEIDG